MPKATLPDESTEAKCESSVRPVRTDTGSPDASVSDTTLVRLSNTNRCDVVAPLTVLSISVRLRPESYLKAVVRRLRLSQA